MACLDHILIAEHSREHKPVLTSSPTSLQVEQCKKPSEMHKHRRKTERSVVKSAKPAVDTALVPTKGLFCLFYLFLVNYKLIT